MANRRMGGMSGGPRGNRSFSQPFQGGGVNPWQGGVPQNNSMNSGLISQITSNPQQLALALSSLLQPQQQMNNPPSLLSLNTSPAFSNQDRDFNRFGNRGRDLRRHEPYNKNRIGGGGWRGGVDKRKGGQNRKRSPGRDKKKGDGKKKDDKKEKKEGAEDDETAENGDVKQEGEEGKEGEEKKGSKEGVYFDVPVKFLNCFVCNKEMWDGESMVKHVRGRAHREMLDSLEESIHITVNILRENMRLAEEKKVIEWHRMQRVSKKFNKFNEMESHCNMCDLKFMGKIVVHRKSDGHQRLKRYLHPNCDVCDKEFPSRMEWVDHRLTPEHLRKFNESLKDKTGGEDGDIIVEDDLDIEPLLEESLQMEVDNPILELGDDLAGLQNLMPAYKPTRAVSTQSLKEFNGFRCELCHRSFADEELSQKHLKSKIHYFAFIEAVKAKYQEQQQEANKAKKEAKAKEETEKNDETVESQEGDREMYDPEEACNEENAMEITTGAAETVEDEEEEEEKVEEVVEVKPDPVVTKPAAATPAVTKPAAVSTPAPGTPARQTRTTAVAASTPGGVKNGAGPKSKKARK